LELTYPLQLLKRQAHAVLHAHLIRHHALLAQNRDALHLNPILHNASTVLANRRRRAFDTRPRADTTAPADDRVEHTSIVTDLGVFEYDRLLYPRARAHDRTWTDTHVRAQLCSRVHVSSRMDENWWQDGSRRLRELLRLLLERFHEVERISRHRRPSSLDLAPEVLGLEHVELSAICQVPENVLLKTDDLILLPIIIVVVIPGRWEVLVVQRFRGRVADQPWSIRATLNRALDARKDGLSREEIDTTINQVRNMRLRLLHIMQHPLAVRIRHNAPEIRRRLIRHPRPQYHRLGIFFLKHPEHLLQRKGAADIGIEHEEAVGAAFEDGVAEVVEAAGGTEGLVLAEVFDGDGGVGAAAVFDEVAEDGFVVVADDEDFADLEDAGDGGEAVGDDGVAWGR